MRRDGAAGAAGDAVAVAWFTMAEGGPEVRIAFSGNGGADFDPPLRLDGGEARGQTALAMLDDQSVVVSWLEGDRSVMMRRVWPDGCSPRSPRSRSTSSP